MTDKILVKLKKPDLFWLRKKAKENNRDVSDMCQQLIHLHALSLFDYKYKFRNVITIKWLKKVCKEKGKNVYDSDAGILSTPLNGKYILTSSLIKAANKEAGDKK